jgi:hypothetical protein
MGESKMSEQIQILIEEKLGAENRLKSSSSWFFAIAGLSLFNSIALYTNIPFGFIFGLGITQIIDGIGLTLAEEIGITGKIIAFIFDCIAAGIFVLFGVFARKKYKWAFIVGMVLYALDGLLFLLVKYFIGFGFHVFALIFIYGGLGAVNKLRELEQKQALNTQLHEAPVSEEVDFN